MQIDKAWILGYNMPALEEGQSIREIVLRHLMDRKVQAAEGRVSRLSRERVTPLDMKLSNGAKR